MNLKRITIILAQTVITESIIRFIALAVCALSGSALAAEKLNIVVLVADDQGWAEPGCYGGNRVWPTPAIDRLAASGLRFTSAYAAGPVCSPTRASLMTGKHPARLHITNWIPGRGIKPRDAMLEPEHSAENLSATEITVAQALRESGYATAQIGKWHLGPSSQPFGFDVAQETSYLRWATMVNDKWVPQKEHTPGAVFSDEVKARLALGWVETNRQKPFFLYVGFHSPHVPLACAPDLLQHFANAQNPVYAGMQVHLDSAVATILNGLTKLGLDERTAVIYLSDNGAELESAAASGNHPLRGGKSMTYEGGVRIPWIMRVPGHTRPGTTSDALISTCDLYPTLLELAGLPLRPDQHRDGVSLVPCLVDQSKTAHQTLAWHYPHYNLSSTRGMMGGYRDGPLKLVVSYVTGKQELFDIARDLGETHDLAGERPKEVARLSAAFTAWKREVGAQEPTPKALPEQRRSQQPSTIDSSTTK